MLNKRRETVIETKKFRKSQLIQNNNNNNNMNDSNRNGNYSTDTWLRNASTPSPPQYSPSITRSRAQGHVNEAFELSTYDNESETPRSRRRQSKITFA